MFVTGVNTATAMRIARYQAEAVQAADQSTARLAANRRFTSFAEDPVSATREISLRAQQGATGLYLRATQDAAAAADAASEGLRSVSDILIDLRTAVLAVDTNDPASAAAVQETVSALTAELTRISQSTTTLGGDALLDGSIASTAMSFTVGAGGDEVDLLAISVDASDLGSNSLKLADIDFTNGTTQGDALAAIDEARTAVTSSLASTSAVSAAMEYHANALGVQAGAIETGLDNLVSVDVAAETIALSRAQLRAETAAALLAQVNALHLSMVRQLLMSR